MTQGIFWRAGTKRKPIFRRKRTRRGDVCAWGRRFHSRCFIFCRPSSCSVSAIPTSMSRSLRPTGTTTSSKTDWTWLSDFAVSSSDSSITVRRLAECRRLLAASPEYLERRGVPQHPEELKKHDLILYTLADNWNELHFRKDDNVVKVAVDGIINANDGQLICAAARRGLGILAQPTYIIQNDLEEGRLVRVLDDWDLPRLTMNAAFPSKIFLPARTRLFLDFLVEQFRVNNFEELWTS